MAHTVIPPPRCTAARMNTIPHDMFGLHGNTHGIHRVRPREKLRKEEKLAIIRRLQLEKHPTRPREARHNFLKFLSVRTLFQQTFALTRTFKNCVGPLSCNTKPQPFTSSLIPCKQAVASAFSSLGNEPSLIRALTSRSCRAASDSWTEKDCGRLSNGPSWMPLLRLRLYRGCGCS